MSSVAITNLSIEPATLPYPFSGVLDGLGSKNFIGTAADVVAIVPSIIGGFRLTDFAATFSDAIELPAYPGQSSDEGVEIVVGNALNGATIADCTILDPGNGSGIIAAIAFAVANPSKQYRIRVAPGTYTLVAADPIITLPANAQVVGAGIGRTTIVGTAVTGVSGSIFNTTSGCFLSDMSVTSPAPVTGMTSAVGSGLFQLGANSGMSFKRLAVTLTGSGSVSHPSAIAFAAYQLAPYSNWFKDVSVTSVSFGASALGGVYGWFVQSLTNPAVATSPWMMIRCSFYGQTDSILGRFGAVDTDQLVIRNCYVRNANGLSWNPVTTGTMRGIDIDGFETDFRGQASSVTWTAWSSAISGTGTVLGTRVRNLRMYGDANVSATSKCASIASGNSGGPATVNGLFLECAAQCSVAGSGSVRVNGERNAMTGATIIAMLGTTGDVLVDTVNVAGLSSSFSIQAICRNITFADSALVTLMRVFASRVSGVLLIGAAALNTIVTNSQIGTLTDNSATAVKANNIAV